MALPRNVFSMRAECAVDVERFAHVAFGRGLQIELRSNVMDPALPDVAVEFLTPASREQVLEMLNEVEDSHVMQQTLRACPLAQNSLERTYD